MLVGIAIKDSILLVDFTEQLRRDGLDLRAAVDRAGERAGHERRQAQRDAPPRAFPVPRQRVVHAVRDDPDEPCSFDRLGEAIHPRFGMATNDQRIV
ncbi:MAG: hypothetical protein WDN24_18305 [Sphingomonas sp.]